MWTFRVSVHSRCTLENIETWRIPMEFLSWLSRILNQMQLKWLLMFGHAKSSTCVQAVVWVVFNGNLHNMPRIIPPIAFRLHSSQLFSGVYTAIYCHPTSFYCHVRMVSSQLTWPEDNKGRKIHDPSKSDFSPWSQFCGYMHVVPSILPTDSGEVLVT